MAGVTSFSNFSTTHTLSLHQTTLSISLYPQKASLSLSFTAVKSELPPYLRPQPLLLHRQLIRRIRWWAPCWRPGRRRRQRQQQSGQRCGDDGGEDRERNKVEAVATIAEAGRSSESLPKDLVAAIEVGRVPGSIVRRFFELEKSVVFRWLLGFHGFKERLLADDLFLTKVAIECGVGIFTKTTAEWERRRENFTKELDFVFADVVMAIIADFMLVCLPAPTVSLRPPLTVSAGRLAKFFYGCPDNAFQVALAGTSYSLLQRIGAIVRNGAKLFTVGTGASLNAHMKSASHSCNGYTGVMMVGTGVTNALINARKAVDKSFAGEAEDVPILSTSVAYGVYMAVSSNLRYQVLAGVIEQRILEPLLHQHKIILSAICFAVRTGNTFLGSLMWVDYARWVGIQKIRD